MRNADWSTCWGAASDTGLHRAHNEDSYLAGPTLCAVADGMGGHQAGEVASDIAIGVLRELSDSASLRAEDIRGAIGRAHDEIVMRGHQHRSLAGMGTTLAGVAVVEMGGAGHWAVFNVGDSRVYRRAGDTLAQVSVDHSEVEELVAAGLLDREQARNDFRRNIITRYLGSDVRPVPDLWVFPPTPGEQFLVCSDGLTGELSDRQILGLMQAAPTPRDAAHLLVTAALLAGGHDNVTVVVVGTSGDSDGDGDTTPSVDLPR